MPQNLGKDLLVLPLPSSASDDSDVPPSPSIKAQNSVKKQRGIIQSLGALGVYTQGIKYTPDSLGLEEQAHNHIFSLSESTFIQACNEGVGKGIEKHNLNYLMRVYPAFRRFKSSNFDPLIVWRRGVQMAALNWQTYDEGMQLNDAMFASGLDRTGYVLKPEEMRLVNSEGLLSRPAKVQKKFIRFSVEVISAQFLPRPRGNNGSDTLPNPYVEVQIYGADVGQDAAAREGRSDTTSSTRARTLIVASNGYNPSFRQTFDLSLETEHPSLVFVRWSVWNSHDGKTYNGDEKAKPEATFTAKMNDLEPGYRHLPLYDHNGDQYLFSTLFCKITREDDLDVERDEMVPREKMGRFRSFGHAVFKRTMSTERRSSKDE